jgi:hypothetical protein
LDSRPPGWIQLSKSLHPGTRDLLDRRGRDHTPMDTEKGKPLDPVPEKTPAGGFRTRAEAGFARLHEILPPSLGGPPRVQGGFTRGADRFTLGAIQFTLGETRFTPGLDRFTRGVTGFTPG